MKTNLSLQRRLASNLYLALILMSGFLLIGNNSMCQPDSASKITAYMSLSYKITDGVKYVKVKVSKKENKKKVSVDNAKSPVCLYLNEVKPTDATNGTGLISKLFLDNDGVAEFELPSNFNSITSNLHEFTFIANFESDPLYEDAQEEITIADAKISIEYLGEDSIKTAIATLMEWKDSIFVPVADAELRLSIKRTFSLFHFSEEGATTDENGSITADLPLDLPGEHDGTIIIVGSVLDHEIYGTVETTKKVAWALLPKENEEMGRTLWSRGNNAPYSLIIVSCSIIFLIWGILFYLVLQLFKIKKLGKPEQSK